MIPLLDEAYGPGRFDITREDLDQAAGYLERLGSPQSVKTLALGMIQASLEHGHPAGPAATGDATCADPIRFWDPAGEWQGEDLVLLVHDRFGNSKYEVFLGQIVRVDMDSVDVRIDELQIVKTFPRCCSIAAAGDPDPEHWRKLVSDLADKKYRSEDLEEQAQGILLQHGEHILTRLAGSLHQDPRFIGLEGRWALRHTLPRLDNESLQTIHHFLLQNPGASLDELLPVIPNRPTADPFLLKISLQSALLGSPDRFENTGTRAQPRWKGLLPARDQAYVIHYAFDPQTFEILCRPGQRLNPRKVKRLQELDLYAYVVTFPEWTLPAQRP